MKLRKAIEANPSNLNFMRECLASNPRYLVTATDTPNILHQGSRHNALHVAAKLGKEEAARLVLHWVVGGELVGRLYPDEVGNLEERVARLSDLYLNMPGGKKFFFRSKPSVKANSIGLALYSPLCQIKELGTPPSTWQPSLVGWVW